MDEIFNISAYSYIFDDGRKYLRGVRTFVNEKCSHLEPCEIIFYTLLGPLLIILLSLLREQFDRLPKFRHIFFTWLPYVPIIKKYVAMAQKKLDDVSRQVEDQVWKGTEDQVLRRTLPKRGQTAENVLKVADSYLSYGDYSWDKGYVSGAVYHGNDLNLNNLVRDVFGKTSYHNPLHPDIFPGIRLMESEVIRMACSLYGGDDRSCGTITSGGTESIFLACKAYRNRACQLKGIKNPVMIIPVTAHAAFDKAAHILKMKVKHIPMDPVTTKVDIKAMKKAVCRNTCMLVGSTPAFPHGSIDPIEEIAKIGKKYDIPVHVDACLGGFLVPFMNAAGFPIPPCDFSVDGVTSISADTHKYAYAPKGSSIVMYKDKSYRHYQYFVQPDWPGGIYGTPSLSGSRSGGIIATCWATLLYHGEDFYVEATKKIINTARYIEKGLRKIPEIFILGRPEVSVIAVGSKKFDIYRLSGALTHRGWSLNVLQYPSGFHLCVTLQHTQEVADRFLADTKECVAEIMKTPDQKAQGSAAIYGMAQSIPDRSIVSELVWTFLDACTNSETRTSMSSKNGKI